MPFSTDWGALLGMNFGKASLNGENIHCRSHGGKEKGVMPNGVLCLTKADHREKTYLIPP